MCEKKYLVCKFYLIDLAMIADPGWANSELQLTLEKKQDSDLIINSKKFWSLNPDLFFGILVSEQNSDLDQSFWKNRVQNRALTYYSGSASLLKTFPTCDIIAGHLPGAFGSTPSPPGVLSPASVSFHTNMKSLMNPPPPKKISKKSSHDFFPQASFTLLCVQEVLTHFN